MLRFIVPGLPATKGSYITAGNSVRNANKRLKTWTRDVGILARKCMVEQNIPILALSKPVLVVISYYLRKPAQPARPYPAKFDADKVARAALDALSGVAYEDDSQCVQLVVSKAWASANLDGGADDNTVISVWDPAREITIR